MPWKQLELAEGGRYAPIPPLFPLEISRIEGIAGSSFVVSFRFYSRVFITSGFQITGQLGLDLLNARKAGIERFGERSHKLIFRYSNGFIDSGKGVLGDQPILSAAEQQPDGRRVVGSLDLGVHCAEIEVQLAGMFRFESMGLEFNDDVTFQPRVVEKQVDKEFIASHFHAKLTPHERKPGAELQQEAGDMADEGIFDIALMSFIAETEEVEVVGILENLRGKPGLRPWEALIKIRHRRTLPEVELVLDLDIKRFPRP